MSHPVQMKMRELRTLNLDDNLHSYFADDLLICQTPASGRKAEQGAHFVLDNAGGKEVMGLLCLSSSLNNTSFF